MPVYYNNLPQNPVTTLRMASVIHIAMLVGQVLFAAVTLFITNRNNLSQENIFSIVVPAMAVFSVGISIFFYRLLLKSAAAKDGVRYKMAGYLTAVIVRDAPLEAASLFGIVCYMLTGKLLLLIISGIIMIYFTTIMPTKDKALTGLNITNADLEMDNNII